MTAIVTAPAGITPDRAARWSPTTVRCCLLALIAAGLISGLFATGAAATATAIAHDGAALTRLMRFMAAVKGAVAIATAAAVLWRMGTAISLSWFAGYGLTCAAMAAGPGLIWDMAHVGAGALLLHGGLFGTILLFWRDPAVASRLAGIVAARQLARV